MPKDTFDDGTSVVTDSSHSWFVYDRISIAKWASSGNVIGASPAWSTSTVTNVWRIRFSIREALWYHIPYHS